MICLRFASLSVPIVRVQSVQELEQDVADGGNPSKRKKRKGI